jgi:hypothetical protein
MYQIALSKYCWKRYNTQTHSKKRPATVWNKYVSICVLGQNNELDSLKFVFPETTVSYWRTCRFTQTNGIGFDMARYGSILTILRTWGDHTYQYTTDAFYDSWLWNAEQQWKCCSFTWIYCEIFIRDKGGNYLFIFLIFGVLTPLSVIFQLYHGDQF